MQISAWDSNGSKVIDFYNDAHAAKPVNADRWIFKSPLEDGLYRVQASLEGHLAYDAEILLGDSLF